MHFGRFCGIFRCVRNISALAGSTKHSRLYLSFSSLYCGHTLVHHNRSNYSVLILQCSLVLSLPRVNAQTTYCMSGRKPKLANIHYCLNSRRFSRYSAPIHWLVHGHMTSYNGTVSRQMPRADTIAKTMTSNRKQFTVTLEMLTAVARNSLITWLFVFYRFDPFALLYN